MPERMRDEQGFTLTEVMVVMALMLVLMATVVPMMSAMSKMASVQTAQAYFAQNAIAPLESFDRSLSQNVAVAATGAQAMTYQIQRSGSTSDIETHVIVAAGGTHPTLTETISIRFGGARGRPPRSCAGPARPGAVVRV